MPRIWLDFCDVLMGEGAITRTRRTFDRALRALPISQHKRVWVEYLDFVKECGVVETAIRAQKRYLKVYLCQRGVGSLKRVPELITTRIRMISSSLVT